MGSRQTLAVRLLAGLPTILAACVLQEPGIGSDLATGPFTDGAPGPTDAAGVAPDRLLPGPDDNDALGPQPAITGQPSLVGCADGSREGFLDVSPGGWPDIAACAGGFSEPGLLEPQAATVRCNRQAGNSARNPMGSGCSATDLCAAGWHLCRGPADVDRSSVSGCESAVPPGVVAFYAAAGGAEPAGHCVPGTRVSRNDLHGCGTYGQPEVDSCYPLDRRVGVADCRSSKGVWYCGEAVDHLREAELARKPLAAQGGVLCCRGP